MKDKITHLYVDSHERTLILHSLVELKNALIRQGRYTDCVVCFGSGAAIGVPLFFLLRQSLSNSAAAICMIVVMLPFFLFALYEKNGLPLEKIIKNIVQVCFIRPKVRPYETDNFYAVLQRQDILDKEVYRIVSGKNKVKPRRQKAD